MPDPASPSLSFEFAGGDDEAGRVAEFLALAQAVYTAAWRSNAATPQELDDYVSSLTWRELDDLFGATASAGSVLRVLSVSHESPLTAKVAGISASALILLAL